VPLAIDEFPALFIAAACAEGRTVLRGARELRVKESDRIASMAEGLTTLGVHNEVLDDGIIIEGGAIGGGDHPHLPRSPHRHGVCRRRPARRAEIRILDCDHVATSFPGLRLPGPGRRAADSGAGRGRVNVPVITVDGPGGAGKGTLAFSLASRLGWRMLDSGALYRVTAYAAIAGIARMMRKRSQRSPGASI
jgi:hypothetical protein